MKPSRCENPDCRREVFDLYRRGGFGNPWLCDKCYFGEKIFNDHPAIPASHESDTKDKE